MAMDKLSPTARKVDYMVNDHRNIKFKSLFIDMDPAMDWSSNSPRVQKLQKSLDSHEDFEFTMSHMFMKDDSLDQAMEVVSADKLFFKGQMLPLRQDARRQPAVQPMACPTLEKDYSEKENFFQGLHTLNQWRSLAVRSENSLEKIDLEKDCFTICRNEEINTLPLQCCPSQAGLFYAPVRYAIEEGPFEAEFSMRNGINIMRSCRLDSTLDLDSCSSSFRSHHRNSFWSSAEKDSRDSSSSSRCSNGSHQDSACIQGNEKKAPHSTSMQLKASHPSVDQRELCSIMGEFSLNADPNHCRNDQKPPISSSSSKWSWKGLFTGLRRASKLWANTDDGRGDVEIQNRASKEEKRSIFTFKELPGVLDEDASGYRRSVGHDWEWQANTYQFVSKSERSMKKGSQHAKAVWGSLGIRDDCEGQQVSTIYCLRSGGRQEAALSSFIGGAGELTTSKREKGKVQGSVWNRCMNKVKKGSTKLSVSACKLAPNKELESNNMCKNASRNMMNEEDKMDIHRAYMKAKSLSSTPIAKSPVRRAEYVGAALNGSYVGLYSMQAEGAGLAASSSASSSSFTMKKSNYKKVGFAASCPASMRSSPHHSGLLNAVGNKATPDLHTAIQGAIAHCKRSQIAAAPAAAAANPPP